MFSGIIEYKSKIIDINAGLFTVERNFKDTLKIGESIAHDGACMTIDSFTDKSYSFFAMEESFKKTNFGNKKAGDSFNVERSLALGDRLHGHFVSGHIDNTGKVEKLIKKSDQSLIIYIKFDESFKKNLIPKGSITINGVSLTIVELSGDSFSISLIPLTQEITNLGDLKIGDAVNLEFDMLGKYVSSLINK